MPKRNWTNGFATGLALGIILLLVFYVFVSFLAGEVDCRQYGHGGGAEASHQEAQKEDCHTPKWWITVQTFVSSEDTLAQWAMTLIGLVATAVSVAAVYYVKMTFEIGRQTLIATQQMARDSREVGEAQVRAYLTIKGATVTLHRVNLAQIVEIEVENTGETPALNFSWDATLMFSAPNFLKREEFLDVDRPSFQSIPAKSTQSTSSGKMFLNPAMAYFSAERASISLWTVSLRARAKCEDVFSQERTVEQYFATTFLTGEIDLKGNTKIILNPVGRMSGWDQPETEQDITQYWEA